MNVLSNSYLASLMDKTVNFQLQGGGLDSQQKLAKFFLSFYATWRLMMCLNVFHLGI